MDFLQLDRQSDPHLRRGQPQERGLARRPRADRGGSPLRLCRAKRGGPRRRRPSCWARPRSSSATSSTTSKSPRLHDRLAAAGGKFHGLVHSIAFADYSAGPKPFHETPKQAFLQAVDVSCFSLIALCHALKDLLDPDASVVTMSISTTQMASENYGYMAPIKAALDSSLALLAKSFSEFSRVRFNAVAPGLLKTSASAGIPGYVDAYLYAEQVIPRKKAVGTEEAAHVAAFLLSPRSSGINAQRIVVDAGMSINYFDRELMRPALREP